MTLDPVSIIAGIYFTFGVIAWLYVWVRVIKFEIANDREGFAFWLMVFFGAWTIVFWFPILIIAAFCREMYHPKKTVAKKAQHHGKSDKLLSDNVDGNEITAKAQGGSFAWRFDRH